MQVLFTLVAAALFVTVVIAALRYKWRERERRAQEVYKIVEQIIGKVAVFSTVFDCLFHSVRYVDHSFTIINPDHWNALPGFVKTSSSMVSFKKLILILPRVF